MMVEKGVVKGGGTHSAGFYVAIYLALLFLTGMSVALAQLLPKGGVLTGIVLILSTVKAYLIVAYYMHVKYEGNAVRLYLYLALLIFVIVLFVIMPDVLSPIKS